MKKEYKHIFEPFTVRRMTMKNRIMMTPMGTNYGESSGEMSFLHINYYEQRAKGGVGLIMVENNTASYRSGQLSSTSVQADRDCSSARSLYRYPDQPCRSVRSI